MLKVLTVARDLSRITNGAKAVLDGPIHGQEPPSDVQAVAKNFVNGVAKVCEQTNARTWQQVAQATLWYIRFELRAPYEGDAWDVWAVLTRQPGAMCNCVAGSVIVALAVWASVTGPPFAVFACEEHCFTATEDCLTIFETIFASWMDRKLFAKALELPEPEAGLSMYTTHGGLARLLVASAASQMIIDKRRDRLAGVVRYGEERLGIDRSPDVTLALAQAESRQGGARVEAAKRGIRRIPASAKKFNKRNFGILLNRAGQD